MIKEVYRTKIYSKYLGTHYYTYKVYYTSGIDRFYSQKTPQTVCDFVGEAKKEMVNAKVTRFYIE